jgi:asparaginyl-tRNA synthetase
MPILTSSDCEGAGEAFRLAPLAPPTPAGAAGSTEFFGGQAFLTVSSQLHLEALAGSLARVYAVTPCFRAERSQTARHLAEFWMLEAELAFVEDVGDVCGVVEGVVRHAALACAAADPSRAEALAAATDPDRPWARMTYTDAVAELERHAADKPGAFAFAPGWGRPLQSEHERWLAESLVGGPVFVTDYPAALKPFYMRANGDGDAAVDAHATVACFDLLVPGVGELAGGSLREERLPLLEVAIEKHGLDRAEYAWYTDLRRYGSAPHGGFGLGVERLVGWLAGVESVRECIPFPRWVGRMLL